MNTNFDTSIDSYVAFDAMSLRQLIIDRLNEQGIFTDQNYLGSNLASIIDIVSYAYNTLIFYLNKTSTESMFTEAQIYENINRIVKTIDYNPVGAQTSTLIVNCSANNFAPGLYTIPRYSSITQNNLSFSFNEDVTFVKLFPSSVLEDISEITQQKILFQGRYQEYPIYTAIGEENEILFLDVATSLVDHFNIDVYVKSVETNTWKQYFKTPNLFLENSNSEKYEIRLNSNKRYEIKFGNNINGKKLQTGDQIAVYYLLSDGYDGVVGSQTFELSRGLTLLNTPLHDLILTDLYKDRDVNFIEENELNNLFFTNTAPSTFFQESETPEQIRQNAPSVYRQQYRLVTTEDYEAFIKNNFANFITDVKACNNWKYTTEYLKYFYNLGLTNTTITDRALFNQIQFADACNFNNIYLTILPRSNSDTPLNYLLPSLKENIQEAVQSLKTLTTEIAFIDPVYKAVTFGIQNAALNEVGENANYNAELVIYKNSQRSGEAIKREVASIFYRYFNSQFLKLGQVLSLRELTQSILNIDGVQTFKTGLPGLDGETSEVYVDGLSLQVWNPFYPNNDLIITQNDVPSSFFECFYFYELQNIYNKIVVKNITETQLKIGY